MKFQPAPVVAHFFWPRSHFAPKPSQNPAVLTGRWKHCWPCGYLRILQVFATWTTCKASKLPALNTLYNSTLDVEHSSWPKSGKIHCATSQAMTQLVSMTRITSKSLTTWSWWFVCMVPFSTNMATGGSNLLLHMSDAATQMCFWLRWQGIGHASWIVFETCIYNLS